MTSLGRQPQVPGTPPPPAPKGRQIRGHAAGISENTPQCGSGEEATLIALGGMPDHVHVLLRLKEDRKLSYLVRDLKAGSSKWIHERSEPVPEFAWQTGYAAFSVSQSQEAKVKASILNQEAHHRRISFEEELLDLPQRHQVEFDLAHLFD